MVNMPLLGYSSYLRASFLEHWPGCRPVLAPGVYQIPLHHICLIILWSCQKYPSYWSCNASSYFNDNQCFYLARTESQVIFNLQTGFSFSLKSLILDEHYFSMQSISSRSLGTPVVANRGLCHQKECLIIQSEALFYSTSHTHA